MPLNADLNQALMLLGHKTLELEVLRSQCEQIAQEYTAAKIHNEALQKRIEELEEQAKFAVRP